MGFDLDALRGAISTVEGAGYDGVAEEAVEAVLRVLYAEDEEESTWRNVYLAIRDAYLGKVDWGED